MTSEGSPAGATGVVLYGVPDIRVESKAAASSRTVVLAYLCVHGDGGERLVRIPSASLAPRPVPWASRSNGSDSDSEDSIDAVGDEDGSGDDVRETESAVEGDGDGQVVSVSLGLVPSLLRSTRSPDIVDLVFSGKIDSAEAARGLLQSLREDTGGRPLSSDDEKFCAVLEKYPGASARSGSLVLKWTDVPSTVGDSLAVALDTSGVYSAACLAVAHLELWVRGSLGPPRLWATKSLKACVATNKALAPLSALDAPGATGGFPSTLCVCIGSKKKISPPLPHGRNCHRRLHSCVVQSYGTPSMSPCFAARCFVTAGFCSQVIAVLFWLLVCWWLVVSLFYLCWHGLTA
jgi:hypothetical protein